MKKEIPKATLNSLKVLTRSFYDTQEERTRLDGMLGMKKNEEIKKGIPERDHSILMPLFSRRKDVFELEQIIEKLLKKYVHDQPLWDVFLKDVKGCGETMAAVILSEIDIHKAETVSKIWQYSGLNPGMVRGKTAKGKGEERKITIKDDLIRGDKKTKGFLSPFNAFLKAKMVGVLAGCMIKSQSEYALIYYYPYRQRLESKDWGETSKNPTDKDRPKAGHQDKAAKRYMIKMFLKDLYVAWRTLEGLDVRPPYAEEYLGKVHQITT